MSSRPIDLIEAPSNLGLRPPTPWKQPGTRRAPDALRAAGLHELFELRTASRVEPPLYDPDESRAVNLRNLAAIADYSRTLAAQVHLCLQSGGFPLVIGGDCSILLGPALALRRLGSYGLVFIDGHTDFYLPEQSGTGGAAGMDLALATGWGPRELTDIDSLMPYFDVHNVLLLGSRDFELRPRAAIPTAAESGMDYWDLPRLRKSGTVRAATERLLLLASRPIEGFWIHLDVDALDDEVMPAVDSRQENGLSWEEIAGIIRTALGTGRAVGMEITIFDPDLDPDHCIARELSRNIASWFK